MRRLTVSTTALTTGQQSIFKTALATAGCAAISAGTLAIMITDNNQANAAKAKKKQKANVPNAPSAPNP